MSGVTRSKRQGPRKKPPSCPPQGATVQDELGAFGLAPLDVTDDACPVLGGDERSHLRAGLASRSNRQTAEAIAQARQQGIGDAADRQHDGHRHAPLAG
jgi:hypothetical protein